MDNESCASCGLKLDIKKMDYSNGGCKHSDPGGYICLAFRNDGQACWMVGHPAEQGMCECYIPREGT